LLPKTMSLVTHLLCPTDFSPASARAFDYAVSLAREFRARLLLLHVVAPLAWPVPGLATMTGFPDLRREIEQQVARELQQLRERAGAGVQLQTSVREGVPHDEILAAADEHGCDLIVMSTHGHTGLKHMLLGSTAERVVRLAKQPVLTLRASA
jgi:nucleotide-binding universal stress UspA family protein